MARRSISGYGGRSFHRAGIPITVGLGIIASRYQGITPALSLPRQSDPILAAESDLGYRFAQDGSE